MRLKTAGSACCCLMLWSVSVPAQTVPDEYRPVLTYLNRQGDFSGGVLKVNIPRKDLAVSVAKVRTPTSFGFSGWIGMTKGEGGTNVMMGDLVLLQDEVNPVISALLANGLEITGLHNHFFWEEPRIFFMHVHGSGAPLELAKRLKPALDLIDANGASGGGGAGAEPAAVSFRIDTGAITRVIGRAGERTGDVYKITVGRDDLKITDMGAPINARMGLNTWAAFTGTDEDAAIAGDVAMLAQEITPVVKTLRANGLDVVALHNHMTMTTPTVFFLHYWGTGPALRLAAGFRAVLEQLGGAHASGAR